MSTQLAVGRSRMISEHLEGSGLVHRVTFDQDAPCPLGDGPAPEGELRLLWASSVRSSELGVPAIALRRLGYRVASATARRLPADLVAPDLGGVVIASAQMR
jgi:hypothetical protein